MLKEILKALLILFGLFCIYFVVTIVYITVNEYKPKPIEIVNNQRVFSVIHDSADIRILTWNIGYCGLDSSMDFFFDGGTQIRGKKVNVSANFAGIFRQLTNIDSIDYILLQEVDKDSKRSFFTNQLDSVTGLFKNWFLSFAINYDVLFIPYPYQNPLGKIISGLITLSKDTPVVSLRISLPGSFYWPKRVVMPKRCVLLNRYKVSNGKELVIINAHNSAFNKGKLKRKELNYIRQIVMQDYKKGNYVIMGGDWSELPPGFTAKFQDYIFDKKFSEAIDTSYLPADWHWIFDNEIPSNRTIDEPFNRETSTTKVIDFYLLSPNIESVAVKTIDLEFENSDHNPVYIHAKLK